MTSGGASRLPPAIIVGLDNITGLQTARVLADRGVPVMGVVGTRRHFANRTRAVRRIVRAPLSGAPLMEALRRLATELDEPAALMPCTDLAVLTLSRHRDQLGEALRIVQPAHDVVETLMDKVRFARHAAEAGLPIPETHVLEDRDDAERAAREMRYPAVVKPNVKTVEWQRHTREKAIPVASAEELLAVYDRCSPWASPLLAQAWVDGPETDLFSCNCYYDRSATPLVTFIARKIRQWPPQTGISCLGVEERNDEVLRDALRLFSGVGYRGLGYVEMKRDRGSGRHLMIEVNVGRPTGRSTIAEIGGVELHYTAYADTMGLPLPEARSQRYDGAKWIYLRHDLQSALHYWRRGELRAGDWWRSLSGVRTDAVLSRRDPLPFAADLLQAAAKGLGRVRRNEE